MSTKPGADPETGRPVFDVSITLPEDLANLVLNSDQVIERLNADIPSETSP